MSQRQFLPLDEDSIEVEQEFDLHRMTAVMYLKQVRFERKMIPQVVTVHPLIRSEPTFAAVSESKQEKSNPSHVQNLTTKEWKDIWRQKFTEMQQHIVKLRKDPLINTRLTVNQELDIDDQDACINFCKSNDPRLSTILLLNQGQLEELIETLSITLSNSIEAPEFHLETNSLEWITKWIYALLACLRSPLDPEVHNILRMIAKSCITVTTRLSTIPDTANDLFLPWNLIIVIIAINFQQFDLLSL